MDHDPRERSQERNRPRFVDYYRHEAQTYASRDRSPQDRSPRRDYSYYPPSHKLMPRSTTSRSRSRSRSRSSSRSRSRHNRGRRVYRRSLSSSRSPSPTPSKKSVSSKSSRRKKHGKSPSSDERWQRRKDLVKSSAGFLGLIGVGAYALHKAFPKGLTQGAEKEKKEQSKGDDDQKRGSEDGDRGRSRSRSTERAPERSRKDLRRRGNSCDDDRDFYFEGRRDRIVERTRDGGEIVYYRQPPAAHRSAEKLTWHERSKEPRPDRGDDDDFYHDYARPRSPSRGGRPMYSEREYIVPRDKGYPRHYEEELRSPDRYRYDYDRYLGSRDEGRRPREDDGWHRYRYEDERR